jgi:type II secretory pathway pseudopilin PulG
MTGRPMAARAGHDAAPLGSRPLGARSQRRDEGFTVGEVVITVMILSIVLIIMFNFLTHATNVTARAEANSRAERAAQLALREATTELRAMDPDTVTTCTGAGVPTSLSNCIRFTINRNKTGLANCPRTDVSVMLHGTAPNRRLRIDRQEYRNVNCSSPEAMHTRHVVDEVSNTSSEPLFTYYASDGSVLNPASAGFTFAAVDSLRVRLFLDYRNEAGRLEFRTVVALRNNNTR